MVSCFPRKKQPKIGLCLTYHLHLTGMLPGSPGRLHMPCARGSGCSVGAGDAANTFQGDFAHSLPRHPLPFPEFNIHSPEVSYFLGLSQLIPKWDVKLDTFISSPWSLFYLWPTCSVTLFRNSSWPRLCLFNYGHSHLITDSFGPLKAPRIHPCSVTTGSISSWDCI